MKFLRRKPVFIGAALSAVLFGGYFGLSYLPGETYNAGDIEEKIAENEATAVKSEPVLPKVVHLKTPEPTKGIYMTQCVAGTPSWRKKLAELIDTTELNSVVVDIKDYSGTIAYKPTDPTLKDMYDRGTGCQTGDMPEFIAQLHEKGIYVIGRITVFQDPTYTKAYPELAVKKLSDGTVWKDYKGLSFIDVGARPYWDYIVALSKDSYKIGFDELNFDYIRFPSDGNMKDIDYTWSRGKTKAEAMREFFEFLSGELKSTGIILSVDLFGMTTTNFDDLNIGQVIEDTFPYFDFIDPMVYPSHYPPNFNGWANPNKHVYEVVNFSMTKAVERAKAASTTPLKLRPWLQDFDYGGSYGPEEVRAQIKATYDAGLVSWLLWDPGNKYTKEALLPE